MPVNRLSMERCLRLFCGYMEVGHQIFGYFLNFSSSDKVNSINGREKNNDRLKSGKIGGD